MYTILLSSPKSLDFEYRSAVYMCEQRSTETQDFSTQASELYTDPSRLCCSTHEWLGFPVVLLLASDRRILDEIKSYAVDYFQTIPDWAKYY